MTATQRVPKPPSRLSGHEGALASVVAIAILGAIVKPWGGEPEQSVPAASFALVASPRATPEPRPSGHVFDAGLYGPFEPAADWSLWPAGYFVSIQFVTRESNADRPADPAASADASEQPGAAPSVATSGSPAAGGPDWPAAIEIGAGDHLLWLGINTPHGWSVRDAVLRRVGRNGASTVVATERLPSPWDDHFTVLGIPAADDADTLAVWPTGEYRLDLTVLPGEIRRTIAIGVRTVDEPAVELVPTRP